MSTKRDPSEYDTFYQSNAGCIIPIITGSISFASSVLIIVIVLRSKRNTAYHRIMIIMSFSDVSASASMALTTIPMPSDVIYDFPGSSYGTRGTCEIQGLAYIIGGSLQVTANLILQIYYLCTLGFEMPEKMYRKRVEPFCFMLLFPCVIIPLVLLKGNDLINPSPFEPYCSIASYPYRCEFNDDIECIHGGNVPEADPTLNIFLCLGLFVGVILSSMSFLIWLFLSLTLIETSPGTFPFADKKTIQVLKVIFHPLQGFFNMLIFVYHKVTQVRRGDEFNTIWDAIMIVIRAPKQIPDMILSRLSRLEMLEMNQNPLNNCAHNEHEPGSPASAEYSDDSLPPVDQEMDENFSDDQDLSYQQEGSRSENLSGFSSWFSRETEEC